MLARRSTSGLHLSCVARSDGWIRGLSGALTQRTSDQKIHFSMNPATRTPESYGKGSECSREGCGPDCRFSGRVVTRDEVVWLHCAHSSTEYAMQMVLVGKECLRFHPCLLNEQVDREPTLPGAGPTADLPASAENT